MKRVLLGVALLTGSTAAWSIEPCCSVVAINAKSGLVSIKDVKTSKVTQYKAEPVGIKALKVGDKVDLVGAQLRPAVGAAIPVQLQR